MFLGKVLEINFNILMASLNIFYSVLMRNKIVLIKKYKAGKNKQ